jgi:Flp pilus assembly protein TadD
MSSPEDEATKQGNLLRDKGDFEGAIAAYTEAIRLNPQNAQPYSGRGHAYLRKGDWDKAITDCNQAIQLDPMMAEAYCTRGGSHGKNGDFDIGAP